jgi:hypothetical protein
MRALVEYRLGISLALSGIAGVSGLHIWPFPHANALLGLVEVSRPTLYASLCYAYATVCFSTPFFLFDILFSLAHIFLATSTRQRRSARCHRTRPRIARTCSWYWASSITAPRRWQSGNLSWLVIPSAACIRAW